MIKITMERSTHDPLRLLERRAESLGLYFAVVLLGLFLALTLEFGLGLRPSTVLLIVLPTSVLLLIGIPFLLARSVHGRNELREGRHAL